LSGDQTPTSQVFDLSCGSLQELRCLDKSGLFRVLKSWFEDRKTEPRRAGGARRRKRPRRRPWKGFMVITDAITIPSNLGIEL
jgi:hypothetical protein